MHEYQNKGVAGKASRKPLRIKELLFAKRGAYSVDSVIRE
jgi:hypothetical protein